MSAIDANMKAPGNQAFVPAAAFTGKVTTLTSTWLLQHGQGTGAPPATGAARSKKTGASLAL